MNAYTGVFITSSHSNYRNSSMPYINYKSYLNFQYILQTIEAIKKKKKNELSDASELATGVCLFLEHSIYLDSSVHFSHSVGDRKLRDNARHSLIFCVSNNVGSQSDICSRDLARVPTPQDFCMRFVFHSRSSDSFLFNFLFFFLNLN